MDDRQQGKKPESPRFPNHLLLPEITQELSEAKRREPLPAEARRAAFPPRCLERGPRGLPGGQPPSAKGPQGHVCRKCPGISPLATWTDREVV